MGKLVMIPGRLIATPGVPAYRGLPRLKLAWVPGWFRLDFFGHGFWVAIRPFHLASW